MIAVRAVLDTYFNPPKGADDLYVGRTVNVYRLKSVAPNTEVFNGTSTGTSNSLIDWQKINRLSFTYIKDKNGVYRWVMTAITTIYSSNWS